MEIDWDLLLCWKVSKMLYKKVVFGRSWVGGGCTHAYYTFPTISVHVCCSVFHTIMDFNLNEFLFVIFYLCALRPWRHFGSPLIWQAKENTPSPDPSIKCFRAWGCNPYPLHTMHTEMFVQAFLNYHRKQKHKNKGQAIFHWNKNIFPGVIKGKIIWNWEHISGASRH